MRRRGARAHAAARKRVRVALAAALFLLLLASAAPGADCSAPCSDPAGAARVVLSLGARRNSTGHWQMKVDAKGDAGPGRELRLDVEAQLQTPLRKAGAVHLTAFTELVAASEWQAPAPSGYEALGRGGSLYKVHTKPATWDAAELQCQQEGAHLVVVDTESEAAVVRALFARGLDLGATDHPDHWHAGFHNRYDISKTITVLGDPLPNYARVGPEPGERYPTQRCGRVKSLGQYVRGPCEGSRVFICEFERNV